MQFAFWDAAGPRSACGPTPAGAWQPTNATGSVRVHVAGSACLAYRVVSIPSPLLDQRYEAGYAVEPEDAAIAGASGQAMAGGAQTALHASALTSLAPWSLES